MKYRTWWRWMVTTLTLSLAMSAWAHDPYLVVMDISLLICYFFFLLPDQEADSNQEDSDTE